MALRFRLVRYADCQRALGEEFCQRMYVAMHPQKGLLSDSFNLPWKLNSQPRLLGLCMIYLQKIFVFYSLCDSLCSWTAQLLWICRAKDKTTCRAKGVPDQAVLTGLSQRVAASWRETFPSHLCVLPGSVSPALLFSWPQSRLLQH